MSFSLFITAIGGVFMSSIPSLLGLTFLYGFWGITTILLFWAAFIKATRAYGGATTQGFAFGSIDAGRGLFAAILASLGVYLFDYFIPVDASIASRDQLSTALSGIILIFSTITLLTSLLVCVVIPSGSNQVEEKHNKISLEGLRTVIKNKAVWLNALIVLCAYVGYKCTDDFSLYASDVLGYNDVDAAHIGTISFWLRPVGALAAGLLSDRLSHSKMIRYCFIVMLVGGVLIASNGFTSVESIFVVLTLAVTSLGIYGLRGLYFALLEDNNIPFVFTGSAAGFISFIGYTPDVFFGPLMGLILDNSPGADGHQQLFLVVAGFALLGLLATFGFEKLRTKEISSSA